MNLERLLSYGFFPKELPPPFTTFPFGQFAAKRKGFPSVPSGYVSRPCVHNLARPGNHRRILTIPNPFNYYLIAKLLNDNAKSVEHLFDISGMSLSKPIVDEGNSRGFVPENDGKDLLEKRITLRAGGRYIVQADISRFYHSIYTHTIPWAIMGKEEAKRNRKRGFGNKLDFFLMNGQDGQTMGIPVGPDASFIISEIIGSAIDHKLQEKKLKGFRFVDDFEFVFLTRSAAERALPVLESILQDFELGLNQLKTHIFELPQQIENNWRLQIRRFSFSDYVSDNEVLEYFDLLFSLYNSNRNEPVIRYGIARLRSLNFRSTRSLAQLLLQCILVEPGTLKETLSLVQRLNLPLPKERFATILHSLIKIHGPLQHGSEIAWALWAAIQYRIEIPDRIIKKLDGYNDSVVALLALHLRNEGLISDIVVTFWEELMVSESLDNNNWLLAYEADLKGWLPSQEKTNHVDTHPLFSTLKKKKISFYDDEVDELVTDVDEHDPYEEIEESVDTDTTTIDNDLPF